MVSRAVLLRRLHGFYLLPHELPEGLGVSAPCLAD
jgi:hypothetical protein